jgi:hypothetical protein
MATWTAALYGLRHDNKSIEDHERELCTAPAYSDTRLSDTKVSVRIE